LDKNIILYCFRFLSDRFLPDKAIDLIDEAGSRVRLRHAQVTNAEFFGLQSTDNILHCIVLAECGSLVLQLPDEAKELDKELRQITKQKNEAVRGQDFEKVYYCCTIHWSDHFHFFSGSSTGCAASKILSMLITFVF
jgi:hypothetical protein